MKYFAKWLPVEGEIKENDTIENDGKIDKVIEILDRDSFPYKTSSGFEFSRGGSVKVKLFLCSRDIQVGNKLVGINADNGRTCIVDSIELDEEETDTDSSAKKIYATLDNGVKGLICTAGDIENKNIANWFKAVGEISPDAVWVKEGDEFDEYEEWWWGLTHNQPFVRVLNEYWDNESLAKNVAFKKVSKVKCSQCKTFH